MAKPLAVELDFTVLYEDDDVLVVDKPAPLLTHPTEINDQYSLWTGLRELLVYELACGGQVSLVNRLDRETSGVILVAKHYEAARALGKAMQERLLHKSYLAVVQGCPAWQRAGCNEPITRLLDVGESEVRVRQCCHPSGKASSTDFSVLQRCRERKTLPDMALLRCQAHTGRMHQIRVHLEHLGYPLVGDKIYGGDPTCYLRFMKEGWSPELAQQLIIARHALHASEIQFPHPRSGETMQVHAPLPPSLQYLLKP
ncbi:MAG: RluA family pseudouridine synthase [Rikenellaceae bacterium]